MLKARVSHCKENGENCFYATEGIFAFVLPEHRAKMYLTFFECNYVLIWYVSLDEI